jgi:plasmid stability protein
MPTLQIRDLPEDVYQGVSIAARAEQRSLSQQAVVELRRALKLDGVPDRDKVLKMLMRSERRLPASFESPEALLREDRESR